MGMKFAQNYKSAIKFLLWQFHSGFNITVFRQLCNYFVKIYAIFLIYADIIQNMQIRVYAVMQEKLRFTFTFLKI